MTARRLRMALALVVAVVLTAVAVWAGITAVDTSAYPPLQIDGRTVAGSYRLSEIRGDRVGAATVCAIAAVAVVALAVGDLRRRR